MTEPSTDSKERLSVRIIPLGETVWEGTARSVSAVNTEGRFDILPRHAGFMTILLDRPITVLTDSKKEQFSFPRALLYADEGVVTIYTGI